MACVETSRRGFVAGALAAGAAATAPRVTRAQAEREGGVCLHLFSKPLQWLGYDDLAETLAQAGYGGIDLAVRPKGHVEPARVEQDLPRAVEAAWKQGLRVEMIVTAITAADEPFAERTLQTAARCGVKVYRTGYLKYDFALGVEGTVEKLNRQMAALAALNQRCGVAGCYQNHHAWGEGMFGGSVWDVYYMLKGLDPAWIGCQYDIRHAVAEAGGSWSVGMRLIAPYIRSVCLKDFVWEKKNGKWGISNVLGGEGMVPWERYFKLCRELRLDMPASVHCEWELLSEEESALPEPGRRRIAAAKLKKDADFFKAQYAKHGVGT